MITKAIYEDGVLKLLDKLDLPEKTKVRVTVRGSFSKLVEELGENEAKEDFRVHEDKELLWIRAF